MCSKLSTKIITTTTAKIKKIVAAKLHKIELATAATITRERAHACPVQMRMSIARTKIQYFCETTR